MLYKEKKNNATPDGPTPGGPTPGAPDNESPTTTKQRIEDRQLLDSVLGKRNRDPSSESSSSVEFLT